MAVLSETCHPELAEDRYSRFFGERIFPLLDRANGTSIAEKVALLLAGERLAPAEIRRRQLAKLAAAVERTRRENPFYRDLLARSGGRGGAGPASSFAPLDGLPVVTRALLAAAGDGALTPGHGPGGSRTIAARTSGSTGSPMTFHRTMEQESWFWALRFRIWRWTGYQPGDRYLTINLNPRRQWKKRLQDRLFRCTYLTFNADNQDSRRIVEALGRRRIPHLNGFSSSLFVLARYMLASGIANPGVVGVTSTGDTLLPPFRDAIESAFGVRVLDYYGAGGEGVHLASQCMDSGERYHLHPENTVVEVLDGDGPAPPGTPGRIVITQLDNPAMPLIRYDLEDVGVLAPADALCPCGRTLPLLERIEGRVADLIWLPDGTFLVPHFWVVLMKNLQTIERYQVVQEVPERLRVRLVAKPETRRGEVEAEIGRAVAAATQGALAAGVEWVDEIPLAGAGKRRLVISEVSRERLGRRGGNGGGAEPEPAARRAAEPQE
jgi:phenylacetate-CoA ligase